MSDFNTSSLSTYALGSGVFCLISSAKKQNKKKKHWMGHFFPFLKGIIIAGKTSNWMTVITYSGRSNLKKCIPSLEESFVSFHGKKHKKIHFKKQGCPLPSDQKPLCLV